MPIDQGKKKQKNSGHIQIQLLKIRYNVWVTIQCAKKLAIISLSSHTITHHKKYVNRNEYQETVGASILHILWTCAALKEVLDKKFRQNCLFWAQLLNFRTLTSPPLIGDGLFWLLQQLNRFYWDTGGKNREHPPTYEEWAPTMAQWKGHRLSIERAWWLHVCFEVSY